MLVFGLVRLIEEGRDGNVLASLSFVLSYFSY
jgi:hypothetical protein